MVYNYTPRGVCSRLITVELNNGVVESVKFTGGCNGNTQGLAKLAVGMNAEDVIERLEDINCGGRGTSCPDQLAKALREALENE
ncbi:MAG: TIGR03905 family TSCPD domain-containing protein [Oscillospiraceae bacterium]|nr:TIGR03905 family TSCPD domain-containing protein [Oscillospiraceae bacterium]